MISSFLWLRAIPLAFPDQYGSKSAILQGKIRQKSRVFCEGPPGIHHALASGLFRLEGTLAGIANCDYFSRFHPRNDIKNIAPQAKFDVFAQFRHRQQPAGIFRFAKDFARPSL